MAFRVVVEEQRLIGLVRLVGRQSVGQLGRGLQNKKLINTLFD